MKKKILISLVALFVFVVTIVVLWFLFDTKMKGHVDDNRINRIEKGMSEAEVLTLLGPPDRRWGDELTRSANDIHCHYFLQNGDEMELVFDPGDDGSKRSSQCVSAIIHRADENKLTLFDFFDPEGTVPSVNTEERNYSRTEPSIFFDSKNSALSVNQINRIEVGMSLNDVILILGEPDGAQNPGTDICRYQIDDESGLRLKFSKDKLIDAWLVTKSNEEIQNLLYHSDPQGTSILYDEVTGKFSKITPLIVFSESEGELIADLVSQTSSGMTKEDAISLLESLHINWTDEPNSIFCDFQDEIKMTLYFDKTLYRVTISNNPFRGYFLIKLLIDRDPTGTRIHYDPETGYFSIIVPE